MSFPRSASTALQDSQLRRNLAKATGTIRAKREAVVSEVPDWPALRRAGRGIKDASLAALESISSLSNPL
jgi:L-lactate dehydrogenase complex protein LldF